jgi:hypothetical protein
MQKMDPNVESSIVDDFDNQPLIKAKGSASSGLAGKPFGSHSQFIDVKEQRRKRDRERYAQMSDQEKQEILKMRREAYKQKKKIKGTKKYADLEAEQRKKQCVQKRQKYENMQPEQKKARLEQIVANREFRRSTPCKESIAMVNPAYIATEEEFSASTFKVYQ